MAKIPSTLNKILNANTARKVPEVIVLFWLIKLLTTAMGESTSDYMVHSMNPILAVLIGAVGFLLAMIIQFYVKKYVPWVYWFAVSMVALFGTMAADVVHIVLGVPYLISTIGFAIILTFVFGAWYKTEHTLSIHSIHSFRREIFYWLAVGSTFALGTAAGDMTAVTFHLGYFGSGILFGVLFSLPFLAYKFLGFSEVFTFWFAYIMTRPLGASFADLFGRSPDLGGIGIGQGLVSVVLTIMIVVMVAYLAFSKIDIKEVPTTDREAESLV